MLTSVRPGVERVGTGLRAAEKQGVSGLGDNAPGCGVTVPLWSDRGEPGNDSEFPFVVGEIFGITFFCVGGTEDVGRLA